MSAKKRPVSRRKITSRYASIAEWSPSLFIRVEKPRGGYWRRDSLYCLGFKGVLDEAVKGVSELAGSIFPSPDVSLHENPDPCVGSIISIRDDVQVVLTVSEQEFAWLLTLSAGGLLGACHLSFSEPFRGEARVYSFSFDKTLPPPEER